MRNLQHMRALAELPVRPVARRVQDISEQMVVFEQAAQKAKTENRGLQKSTRIGPLVPKNATFQKNMRAAEQAIDYAQSLSTVSTSRPSHIYEWHYRDEDGKIIHAIVKTEVDENNNRLLDFLEDAALAAQIQTNDLFLEGYELTKYEVSVSQWRHLVVYLRNAAKDTPPDQLVANCFEKSLLGFDFLANQPNNPQLDVVGLLRSPSVTVKAAVTGKNVFLERGPDHALLIIGREPGSDLRDPTTWGVNAIVCDPWAKRAYSAVTFQEEMDLLSSTTNGEIRCEALISAPANKRYTSDPRYVYLTQHGAGSARDQTDQSDQDALIFPMQL